MPMNDSQISDNIARIQERILRAAERAGRAPQSIALMAVTKFHPAEAILDAYHAGIRLFGENRVQEAQTKYPPLRDSLAGSRLHMIGTLQKNKINKALGIFDALEGIDSVEVLEAILARLSSRTEPIELFFELHTGEESKAGFPSLDELLRACDLLASFAAENREKGRLVVLRGLMTMAPFTTDERAIRHSFRMLAAAKAEVAQRFDFVHFTELSMGMSNDFEIAIEEGSTLVRIGTALFGERA
jgi:hypothetical protein